MKMARFPPILKGAAHRHDLKLGLSLPGYYFNFFYAGRDFFEHLKSARPTREQGKK